MLQILLAEDNEGDVILVQQVLAEHQIAHTLHLVSDGDEALQFLDSIGHGSLCPDVLLLDLNLPKVDGGEVLKQFRSHPDCTKTPVIIVTSSDAPKDRKRVETLGANAYFRKPSDLHEYMVLGTVIKDVLQKSAA